MAACEVEIMKQKEIEKIKRQLQLPSEEELAKLVSIHFLTSIKGKTNVFHQILVM